MKKRSARPSGRARIETGVPCAGSVLRPRLELDPAARLQDQHSRFRLHPAGRNVDLVLSGFLGLGRRDYNRLVDGDRHRLLYRPLSYHKEFLRLWSRVRDTGARFGANGAKVALTDSLPGAKRHAAGKAQARQRQPHRGEQGQEQGAISFFHVRFHV